MASIQLQDVSLTYRIRNPLTLRQIFGVDDRSKGVREVKALVDVSFELKAGDRLGLVGHNGAGKTTLLKVLYGIYQPGAGRVAIDGHADALFNINLGFRPEATGRRNIQLRGLIEGWSAREIKERAEEIIAFSELGDFIDLPFKTYSQGMAARLAFATATAKEPDILLMDEWIGAGDQAFQKKARARMNELAQKARILVLASHNLSLIKQTCNKILELEHGRIKTFCDTDQWLSAQLADAS